MKVKLLIAIFFLFILTTKAISKNDYFNEGLVYFEKKELDKAKFKFEQDIVFNPKSERSYLYLSRIFKAQEKKELEEKNLNTVILLNPQNEEATYNLAELKLQKSDFKESKNLIDKLLMFCEKYCEKSQKLKVEIENSLKK